MGDAPATVEATSGVTAAAATEDRVLLEGPHSRRKEFWLVVRALRDFIAGFRALHFVGPCVTVFTGKIADFPIVLIGREYWEPFIDMLTHMTIEGTVGTNDLKLLMVTDDVSDAMAHIRRYAIEPFGLRRRVMKPSPLLGERRPQRS